MGSDCFSGKNCCFNVIVLSTGEIINISEEWVPTVLVGKIAASIEDVIKNNSHY